MFYGKLKTSELMKYWDITRSYYYYYFFKKKIHVLQDLFRIVSWDC